MNNSSNPETPTNHFRKILFRPMMIASGRLDAFKFAIECEGDIAKLQEKLRDSEDILANPPDPLERAMKPNAGPGIYKEGYIEGLREAIKLLTNP